VAQTDSWQFSWQPDRNASGKPARPFRKNLQAPLKRIELGGDHRHDRSGHGRLLILIHGDSQQL
jgi:hypothetical protein